MYQSIFLSVDEELLFVTFKAELCSASFLNCTKFDHWNGTLHDIGLCGPKALCSSSTLCRTKAVSGESCPGTGTSQALCRR